AGRLHPQKDPLLLLQSFAEVRRTNSQPVHLLVAGDGELMESMQAEIERLGIGPGVSLLGAQPQEQLIALHQCADLCILTSATKVCRLWCSKLWLAVYRLSPPAVVRRPKLLSQASGVVCDAREPEAIAAAIARCSTIPIAIPRHLALRIHTPMKPVVSSRKSTSNCSAVGRLNSLSELLSGVFFYLFSFDRVVVFVKQ
ncbi:MAG: glycosyltransferase, partial [Synechococcales cyanobacterium RU_4_20]|nr:glycosyltransferase [Synechococcales cyanobacterium RU_4_20]